MKVIRPFRNKRSVALLLAGVLMCGLPVLLSACGGGEKGDPALRRGIQFVRYLSARNQLTRSSFLVVYPEGKPSDFVKWMFSTMGTAEWPPSEEMAEADPMIAEQAKSIRAPLLPKGVALVPVERDLKKKRQVVIRADDAAGILIADAYLDPNYPPAMTRQWLLKLPK